MMLSQQPPLRQRRNKMASPPADVIPPPWTRQSPCPFSGQDRRVRAAMHSSSISRRMSLAQKWKDVRHRQPATHLASALVMAMVQCRCEPQATRIKRAWVVQVASEVEAWPEGRYTPMPLLRKMPADKDACYRVGRSCSPVVKEWTYPICISHSVEAHVGAGKHASDLSLTVCMSKRPQESSISLSCQN